MFGNQIVDYLQGVGYFPITFGIILSLLILLLLLVCSALMSGTESAYFSLSPADIDAVERNTHKSDKYVLKNIEDSEKLLATVLIGNNLVNVAIVILSSFITNSLIDFSKAPLAGFVFQVVIITFILLLFGEIMPKVLATNKSLKFSRFVAYPIYLMIKVLRPLNSLLISSTYRIGKRFAPKKNISMDELSDALDITTDGIAEEKKILHGIVNFGNIMVSEIMKPRIDVVAVEDDTPFEDLKKVVVDSGYSRIPVYHTSFDGVKGILYVKDLIPYIDRDNSFRWQNLIRAPYFVPESKKINALLAEFQVKQIHMAIVVDEYGGKSGIITLEDILEEIVGEISDESDEDIQLYTKIDSLNYMFEAKVQLNDFCKIVNCDDYIFDDVRGEAETLAGLILEITGHIPAKNEMVKCKNFNFTIDAVDNKRIKRIKVQITSQPTDNA
ncbi:MAG TPA: gliding motility-associated protein GldE [Tenuifilaceae bacterium]|nr:gliding motility-associated protein GldE [Tenuifilaceae bacterium]HPI45976.1 gliding motility-associated protein GldE [Tenuifilaceae bacterium]HPN21625.1 gliding motility-associated protein GldE [Tenuifilaceae bacterium]